jgi:hypothetical protein
MKLSLIRQPSFANATMGRLYIDGVFACATLEDEVREIPGTPVEVWKVKGDTAIPAGTYRIALQYSGRFGAETPTLMDVPGFEYIRIHAGNTYEDTEGCILLGLQATDHTLIGGTSRPAVQLVRNEMLAAVARGESITIDISNAEMSA